MYEGYVKKWSYFSYIIFFFLTNFLIIFKFLVMLSLRLLRYVSLDMENSFNNVSYLFRIVTNSLKHHNYIITCFDTITNFKWHEDNVSFWYVWVTYESYVLMTLVFGSLLLNKYIIKYVFLISQIYVLFSYVLATYRNYVTVTLRFVL